jgi:hypothetical protein
MGIPHRPNLSVARGSAKGKLWTLVLTERDSTISHVVELDRRFALAGANRTTVHVFFVGG